MGAEAVLVLPLRFAADLLPGIVAGEVRAHQERGVRSWQCRHATESGSWGVPPRRSESKPGIAIYPRRRLARRTQPPGAQRHLPLSCASESELLPTCPIAICGFLPSKLSHAHHPPRLPNPARLRDENCPGRHLTWGPATRLHHLTGGDPAPCLVAGEGDQR